MSVEIVFDGKMGKVFGKRRNLHVKTVGEAIRYADMNQNGLKEWMRNNLSSYKFYKVKCTYKNGTEEFVTQETVNLVREELAQIRFTPIIEGAGGKGMSIGMIILGVVLVAAAFFTGGASLAPLTIGAGFGAGATGITVSTAMIALVGVGMILGGIVGMLTPQQKVENGDGGESKNKNSYYFNGPQNTVAQGLPVPLIYGRCLVGSQAISASYVVNDIVVEKDGKIKDVNNSDLAKTAG